MPAKSVVLTLIVSWVVWTTNHRTFATAYGDYRHLYAEVKDVADTENMGQDIVMPMEVDAHGQPLVNYPSRRKRDLQSDKRRYFILEGFGESFHLDVDSESQLLAPSFKIYHLGKNDTNKHEDDGKNLQKCLFRGHVKNQLNSAVAINLCGGMTGFLKTESSDYLIEPIHHSKKYLAGDERLHILTKRSVTKPKTIQSEHRNKKKDQKYFCGKKRRYMPHQPKRKDHWLPDEFAPENSKNISKKNRIKRWTNKQTTIADFDGKNDKRRHYLRHKKNKRSVETLVVADREMVKKHGTENVTNYLLTVFNMVAMLYQDSTIGNNVSVILVGLVLLEGDEPGLSISHNAENSLNSFCQWQSTIHTSKGHHHDHAVLVTGLDICSWKNEPCDTLGYAPISGMCSKYRSCTLNEDSGLALAFTVAHEIGHNFGMVHDGQGSSPCRRKRGTLMSASLSGLDTSVLWSDCSRRDLAKFLESPRSLCLKNEPDSPDELQFPDHLPGQLYDADMQCRLQFGTKSRLCEHYPRQNEVCKALWCQRNGRECETKFLPAAEGTPCGKHKWCRKGSCIDREVETLKIIEGGWSNFTSWSQCSRSCGGGLMSRERFCDSPPPSNGGNYCKGEEKEYKICNSERCSFQQDHQDDQCEAFNKRTVKGKIYKWRPYGKDLGALSRCRIYCMPDKEDLYLVLSTKLQDGTSCNGNYSSVCVEGECRTVGCDGKIESNVLPDRCGICNGNNSSCKTVRGTFIASNLSAGYYEVVTIPSYSRQINISEEQETPSYLVLRNKKGLYQLNGNWTLNWPGRYSSVGTMFSYRRWPGKPESIISKGPTQDDLFVEVLVQEATDIVINYEFVISATKYYWKSLNSTCSVTCGNGKIISTPRCVDSSENTVNDTYCNASIKPKIVYHSCNDRKCLSKWYVGQWSTCGPNSCDPGIQTRQVYCTSNGIKVSNSHCDEHRPSAIKNCPKTNCYYKWYTGSWSKCRGKCPAGFQTRSITCRRTENGTAESFDYCKEDLQPPHMRKCKNNNCFTNQQHESTWVTGPWGACEGKCQEEKQERNVSCIRIADGQISSSCNSLKKPIDRKNCSSNKCSNSSNCEDTYLWCTTQVNEKLCKLDFYSTKCCISCKNR